MRTLYVIRYTRQSTPPHWADGPTGSYFADKAEAEHELALLKQDSGVSDISFAAEQYPDGYAPF